MAAGISGAKGADKRPGLNEMLKDASRLPGLRSP
jgi:DNA invertase Pin-like site-specific DNA recombinase